MSIIISESACNGCIYAESCMIFYKINGIGDNRKFRGDSGHKNDVIEIIIRHCTVKNYDRSYKV